ncbi:MAG: serine dehydrogenasease [Harvfovirus sp.]|uniref:Serine dehydrogenasease n=1 Tax=Harvfovirus sp. TaxID=2487768 RepID=A0A3G5A0X7_9VIRU|nr:MAG: serine dehydrogenasease [Harvfovirus sp.]
MQHLICPLAIILGCLYLLSNNFAPTKQKYLSTHNNTSQYELCPRLNIITILGNIDEEEFKQFEHQYEQIQNNREPLTIIIYSLGGYVFYAREMLKLLNQHQGAKYCYVHRIAASAASVITLHCDKIFMDRGTMIGPIDPLIRIPFTFEYRPILEILSIEPNNTRTYKLAMDIYSETQIYLKKIFSIRKLNILKQTKFKELFFNKNVPHDERYFSPELIYSGLDINVELNQDITDIMNDKISWISLECLFEDSCDLLMLIRKSNHFRQREWDWDRNSL